jgi:dipeptidyl aminopeptidase/acylaminoacyl peptidase
VKTLKTFDSPGKVKRWILDRAGSVRAAITDEDSLRSRAFYRASEDGPWQLIGDYGLRDHGMFPVGFDGDGALLVSSNVGRDTLAIYTYDPVKNARGELVAGHERIDIAGGLVYDRLKKKIAGVRYDYDRASTAWVDEEWAKLQASVDAALPDHANALVRIGKEQRLLIHSYSDVDPGAYYLMDIERRRIEPLLTERKGIKAEAMSPMEVTSYTARDGLRIPAYLTLPKGREAKNLPLVVYVHGGPWVRGYRWRWDPQIQYLAAQGYAVLAPEPRGSTGYGGKLYMAGWKQWGLAMQDDLNDGVRWLADRGIADPKRVCIMGASYGGYAVMMGLARDPDVWRCGINFVGVTDLTLLTDITWADYSDSNFIKYAAKEMVGDSSDDAERFRKTSPLQNAARIKSPVLMPYGGLDRRVPIEHGTRMRAALDHPGMTVEWVMYPEEGHGFHKEANQFDFQRRVQKFLGEQLKPSAQPSN